MKTWTKDDIIDWDQGVSTDKCEDNSINYSNTIFKKVKQSIINYLSVFKNEEAGMLITWDGEVIPVTNTAEFKNGLFEITDKKDLLKLFKLYDSDNLFAIAHNHPHGLAIPSSIDIEHHSLPCHMIIYSNLFDYIAIYPETYLKDRKNKHQQDFKHLTN